LLTGAEGLQHNKTLRKLQHFSPILANKIKRNDVDRTCLKQGRGHVFTDLVGNSERNRLLGKPKGGWDNIEIDFR
jgi:hypothetical protein